MLAKRIIPCLDVKEGRVVKGKCFIDLQEAGDPVAMAKYYEAQGADELVLLDITASIEGRATFLDMVTKVARELSIPLSVGGGVQSLADIRCLLNAGADRVSLNSAALKNPQLIGDAASLFGSQCIILAIDVKKTGAFSPTIKHSLETCSRWEVFSHSGSLSVGKEVLFWALEGQNLGAGELLITSIDRDGTQKGYDLALIQMLSAHLSIPIIASGGVGKWEDIKNVFIEGKADAALAASLFHFDHCTIGPLKKLLAKEKILVRL